MVSEMIVQERSKQWHEGDSGDSGDDDIVEAKRHLGTNLSCSRRVSSYLADNISKVVIVVFVFLSLLILGLVRNRGETAALLCIESVAKEVASVQIPVENFRHIPSRRDNGRYASLRAEKWVVVVVSVTPTAEVQELGKVQGWQLLAIGTSQAPSDWRVNGAIFLSIDQQIELGYRITSLISEDSYGRKNIGYLFAIQHGARVIYDAYERAALLQRDLSKVFDVELTGAGSRREPILQYQRIANRKVINPFIHFGQRSVWPRGLPLESVSKISPDIHYGEIIRGKEYIQQSLGNGLPDVDSIFYFTRKSQNVPLDIQFDSHAPPVTLPQGTMVPINALNTLVHSPAFWSLLLPVTVSPKSADIVRGYWAQRLLWEVGGVVGVYPPLISRVDKLEPTVFAHEKDMHADAGNLVSLLLNWRSNRTTLFQKILHLSQTLAAEDFWREPDVHLTLAWLRDLVSVGYKQPRLSALELDKPIVPFSNLGTKQFLPHTFPAVYLGVEDSSGMGSQMAELVRWRHFFGNIVLILECTTNADHTALGWRMFYGRLFKHVVVLSPEANDTLLIQAVTWQSYKVLPGIFDLYPNADGFLYLRDDVVLNYWNLEFANKTKLWCLHKVSSAWHHLAFNDSGAAWYYKPSTKKNIKRAVRFLPPKYEKMYRMSMDEEHFVAGGSDIFYVPQRYVNDFITLVTPADKAQLRFESAIPLIFMAMDKPENYEQEALSNTLYLDESRKNADPSSLYTIDLHALHPWKAGGESQLIQLFKSVGKGDPLFLDIFD